VTLPVSYVELNRPDLEASSRFFASVFGWELQPFATPEYLVAPHGDAFGVDGAPRTVPIIRGEPTA
jgi:predicted enzyme related to lactoylglutathione lyase